MFKLKNSKRQGHKVTQRVVYNPNAYIIIMKICYTQYMNNSK